MDNVEIDDEIIITNAGLTLGDYNNGQVMIVKSVDKYGVIVYPYSDDEGDVTFISHDEYEITKKENKIK